MPQDMAALASMHWSNTFLTHWKVPAAPLASHLPRGLHLDLYRGQAWVTLAALRLRGPFPGPFPPPPIDPLFAIDQINVRTYVIGPEGPGIFLLDTMVNSRLAAFGARQVGLPYRFERSTHVHRGEHTLSVLSPSLSIYGDIVPGVRRARAGSRDHFLLERYRIYTGAVGGLALGSVTIAHEPWRYRRVELSVGLPSSIVGFPGADAPVSAIAGSESLHVTLEHIGTHVSPVVRELASELLPSAAQSLR